MIKKHQINDEINFKSVLLLDENGKGNTVSIDEALKISEEKGLDLVLVSHNEDAAVCKMMDYSKYLYNQSKKEKENKKNQKKIEIKEIQLSPSINEHDIDTKVKQTQKLLDKGCRINITVQFKGRECLYMEIGKNVMNNFLSKCKNIEIIMAPKVEGRNLIAVIKSNRKDI